tara:strand:- start:4265 stop:4969 length:705 start_codon:yes stop_codon:yes gene_type:complete
MSNIEKISSKDALGNKIGCVTLTKPYFKKIGIDDNSSKNLPFSLSEYKGLPVQYMNQIHGTSVQVINDYVYQPIENTDALFTNSSKVSLAIMSADCLPIAIANSEGTEIALIHAGWRGLASGIIDKTLKMFDLDNRELNAWLAPCISQKEYEVGNDVYEAFIKLDEESVKSFKKINSRKWLFDMKGQATRILDRSGVSVSQSNYCTYKDEELFYSYRRDKTDKRILTLLWRKDV